MIEVRHVWKRYHTFKASDWVLRDIDLVIPPNVSVGVIGRNGAGKSTLLRLIAAMDSPERGQVVRHCRVSWPIGLFSGLQPTMTGRQNVKFVARIHGDSASIPEVMAKVEDFAEIGDAMDRPIRTYSSGMRARFNFGLSLAFDFDVYLSDEATAVGDAAFRKKAAAAFKERVGQASLIMVSHQEGILKELCQAGVLIDQGHAYWFDDVNEALKAYGEMMRPGSAARAVH
jgi:capsular polysaccharide transport system ATP-binding protein